MDNKTYTPHKIRKISSLWPFLRPYKTQLFLTFAALTLAALTVLTIGYGLRYVIDEALTTKNIISLRGYFYIFFIITLLLALASYCRFYLISKISEDVIADLRNYIFSQLIQAKPSFFEKVSITEVLSRLTTDTTIIQTVVGSSGSMALRNILLLLGGTIMLFYTNAALTSFVFLTIPIIVIPIIIMGKNVKKRAKIEQDNLTSTSTYIDESLKAIQVVQAFNQEQHCIENFQNYVENTKNAAISRIKKRAFLTAMVIILVFTSIGLLLLFGGYQVVHQKMTGGQLSEFTFYAVIVASSIGSLSEIFGALQRAAGSIQRIEEILTLPSIYAHTKTAALTQADNISYDFKGSLHFKHVSFTYPTKRKNAALTDISFTIQAGQTIALIGSSGAGKTTIFQLLLGFEKASSGAIFLDDYNIASLEQDLARKPFAYVPQDPIIFSTSLIENIKFGNPSASQTKIKKALSLAALDDFIKELPDGVETNLGQRGLQLSGGQKQRIALARAFLAEPKILLLDEATNALDAYNEELIYKALQTFKKQGTTILVITHRILTVTHADSIIILDKGKLMGHGSHIDLEKNNAFYKKTLKLYSQDQNKKSKKQ